MKRLMLVGGIAVCVALSVAAQQHSPPVLNPSTVEPVPMALSAPSLEPVPTLDLRVVNYTVTGDVVAPGASLSNQHVARSRSIRPSWRRSIAMFILYTDMKTSRARIGAMRGWGFL